MSTEKPNGKTQAQNPVESSVSLGEHKWGMSRIVGEVIARPDGSCYWECDDGVKRECVPTMPLLNPDQARHIWSQHASETDAEQIQHQWRIYHERVARNAEYQQKMNQLMEAARLERRRSEESIVYRFRVEMRRIYRRIYRKLLGKLLGFYSCGNVCSPNAPGERPDKPT